MMMEDFDRMVEAMSREFFEPDIAVMSPRTRKRLLHLARVARLNAAHPMPKRRIRQCLMRKLYTLRRKRMRMIRRIERQEARTEMEILAS